MVSEQPAAAKTPVTPPAPASAPADKPHPKRPATHKQMGFLAAFLLVSAGGLIWGLDRSIERLNSEEVAEVWVDWTLPPGVTLNPGPVGFRYDSVQKRLKHRGIISAERKLELWSLLAVQATDSEGPADTAPPATQARVDTGERADSAATTRVAPRTAAGTVAQVEAHRRSYHDAIDHLAYRAATRQASTISLLLMLGLMGGALGAILRSLVDFVGHACYTEQLDLDRWWPLYFTRPIVGGILGFILVVLFKAKLLTTGGNDVGDDDSLAWLGLAIIGGFSTVDVTLRLRLAAKALFGVESGSQGNDKSEEGKKKKETASETP